MIFLFIKYANAATFDDSNFHSAERLNLEFFE